MTSTEFTIGLDGGARNSSKVLKPPGGGSSDIFGLGGGSYSTNGSSNTQSRNVDNGTTKNRLFGASTNEPASAFLSSPVRNQVKSNAPENVPVPKSTTKRYVRRNPITGEEIEYFPENQRKTEVNGSEENDNSNSQNDNDQNENNEEKKTEKVEEEAPPKNPPKNCIRVRAPPGGKSSGIFF